jgi:hypothetical protein
MGWFFLFFWLRRNHSIRRTEDIKYADAYLVTITEASSVK